MLVRKYRNRYTGGSSNPISSGQIWWATQAIVTPTRNSAGHTGPRAPAVIRDSEGGVHAFVLVTGSDSCRP